MDCKDSRIDQFRLPHKTGALFELKKNPDDTNEALNLKFVEKKQLTHDTFIYYYEIPENMTLGLNLGQHIAIDADIVTEECPEGEPFSRKYTPISSIFQKGRLDLLVKVYYKNVHPQFPEGGKMTNYLNNLELGQTITVRGPFGKLNYLGDGNFKILKKFKPLTFLEKRYSKVGMIAGGSGITPFFQILQECDLKGDSIEFGLVFANKTSKDIFLKDELNKIKSSQKFKFNLTFTIDNHEDGWTGSTGHVSKEMIQATCPAPSDDTLMLTCGPPAMCRKFLLPMLLDMGYNEENIFDF